MPLPPSGMKSVCDHEVRERYELAFAFFLHFVVGSKSGDRGPENREEIGDGATTSELEAAKEPPAPSDFEVVAPVPAISPLSALNFRLRYLRLFIEQAVSTGKLAKTSGCLSVTSEVFIPPCE